MTEEKVKRITLALGGWLNQYRKLPDIIDWLKFMGVETNEREFADYVEEYRKQDHEYYLESCSSGYRFTRDINSIRKSCFQRLNKGVSMIKHAKRDLESCGDRNQIALIDKFLTDYEAIVRVANDV